MLIYEILTWLIIQLGKLRAKYVKKVYWDSYVVRYDRAEINRIHNGQNQLRYGGIALECCDCGLTHTIKNWDLFKLTRDLHCVPHRPKNYKYKFR